MFESETAAAEGSDEEAPGGLEQLNQNRRQRPPRLHDLPSLQKLCSSRFGWSASKIKARFLELAHSKKSRAVRR